MASFVVDTTYDFEDRLTQWKQANGAPGSNAQLDLALSIYPGLAHLWPNRDK